MNDSVKCSGALKGFLLYALFIFTKLNQLLVHFIGLAVLNYLRQHTLSWQLKEMATNFSENIMYYLNSYHSPSK